MDGQLSFATLDYAGKKKRTKRDVFLAEMVGRGPRLPPQRRDGARPHHADRSHDPTARRALLAPNTCSMRARIRLLAWFARSCANDSGWLRRSRR